MLAPTAAEIRSWSQLDFSQYGYGDDIQLQRLVTRVVTWLEEEVGRTFAATNANTFPGPQMQEVTQLATEWKAMRTHPDFLEGVIDNDTVQSFTTSNYSEVRRGPHSFAGRHPHPEIAALLVDIAVAGSPASAAHNAPQVGAVEPDWEVGREILDAQTRSGRSVYDMRPESPWTGGQL